jgi:transglutaminase-like putative cysteine protease
MTTLLFAAFNRLRPRGGWLPFLLLLVALLCTPAALYHGATDPAGTEAPLLLTPLAVILGLRVAHSRLSARAAAFLGGLLGAILVPVFVGRLLPPLGLLWREIGYTFDWLSQGAQAMAGRPAPFASVAASVWQQLNDLGARLWWWGQTVAAGGQVQDKIIPLLTAALLAWTLALFATWQIYRRRAALVGLLPSGGIATLVAFFSAGIATFYLILFLFCSLSLFAICHFWAQRDRWEQTGTDYPGELGLELVLTLGPSLALLLALAALFPSIYPHPLRDAFWDWMEEPWSEVERVAERVFGPIETGYPRRGAGAASGGELPRAHLLGAPPELSETVVLYVDTNDPPPPRPDQEEVAEALQAPPRRYWRSKTYAIYTGRGWENGPLESRIVTPNRPLDPDLPPGFDLLQQFRIVAAHDGSIYAVNAPQQVDRLMEAWWRAPDDLVQLDAEVESYTVISRPPAPTIAELRAGSPITATLPPDLADRYLALPDTIPQRVLDLAQDVAGSAATRYDRARAIEQFLRAYPYNLDLPQPPSDRDLVDYFLFDLQEGYCDYYASAMVVMARAVGVPARFATGYAQGSYDHEQGRWVVTEQDGHSWVEVYFDGIGWVEFEPTAGLPGLERPGGQGLPEPPGLPLPARDTRWWERIPWPLLGLAALMVLLVAAIAWLWRPRRVRTLAAADLVRDRYARLLRWGSRLGHPPRDGQTPYEYGATLNDALGARGRRSSLRQIRQATVEAPPDVERLTQGFVRTQYSPEPVAEREGWQIRDLWRRLRRWLWWLWLARGSEQETEDGQQQGETDPPTLER